MIQILGSLCVCLATLLPVIAHATPKNVFGLDAPNTARAMTVTASAPPTAAAATNPALLIQMAPDSIELTTDFMVADDKIKINGKNAGLDSYLAWQVALAAAIPLGSLRDRLFAGVNMHLPNDGLYHTHTPTIGEPVVFDFGTESRHLSLDAALGIRIWERIAVGIGFHLVPTTQGQANISFANQKESSSTDVKVQSQFAPIVGLYAEPVSGLHLGLSYHGAIRFEMEILADIFINDSIGSIHTKIKSASFTEPHALAFGVRYDFSELVSEKLARVAANLDFEWMHYDKPITTSSQIWLYDDGGSAVNSPENNHAKFQEGFSLRTAIDWMPLDELTVSLGYAFWKTPIPAQRGAFNVLDSNRHNLAFGAVYWLPDALMGSFDMGFATAMKFDFLQKRQMEKFEYLPGNPGFPYIELSGMNFVCHFSLMMRFQ